MSTNNEIFGSPDPSELGSLTPETAGGSCAQIADWLNAVGAKLDATATMGNVATKLIAYDAERRGTWTISLRTGIDVVNDTDGYFMGRLTPLIVVETKSRPSSGFASEEGVPFIDVSWTGTDGETRHDKLEVHRMEFASDQSEEGVHPFDPQGDVGANEGLDDHKPYIEGIDFEG